MEKIPGWGRRLALQYPPSLFLIEYAAENFIGLHGGGQHDAGSERRGVPVHFRCKIADNGEASEYAAAHVVSPSGHAGRGHYHMSGFQQRVDQFLFCFRIVHGFRHNVARGEERYGGRLVQTLRQERQIQRGIEGAQIFRQSRDFGLSKLIGKEELTIQIGE